MIPPPPSLPCLPSGAENAAAIYNIFVDFMFTCIIKLPSSADCRSAFSERDLHWTACSESYCACTEEEGMLSFTRRTERKLRDRNSQLVVPNKSFARVHTICEQQLNLMKQPLQRPNHSSKPVPTPARVPVSSTIQSCTCSLLANPHMALTHSPSVIACAGTV